MIRPRKVRAVAAFEFVSTIKRKGYLIATFGMPLFLAAYVGVIALISVSAAKKADAPKLYGIVDHAALIGLTQDTTVRPPLPEAGRALVEAAGPEAGLQVAEQMKGTTFRPFANEKDADSALRADQVKGYFVLPTDYLATGKVDSYVREASPFASGRPVDQLGQLIVERLLAGRVEPGIARLIRDPVTDGEKWTVKPDGSRTPRSTVSEVSRFIVPVVFAMLFMISLMFSASSLLLAVSTEKENRVVEVLLSSADPDEILAGKLLGLGGAGLIQVAIWFGMAAAAGLATTTALALAGVAMPWAAIVLAVPYFMLGYLLIGSLMLGTAALGSSMREAQQLSMVWTIPTIIPLVAMNALMAEPHGTLARVLTFIPFTAPITSILRLGIDPRGFAWWEVAASLFLLAAAIWLAIKLGARLFRIGVLLGGARPKLAEIFRQALLRPR